MTLENTRAGDIDTRRQRSALIAEIAVAFPVSIALWLGVYYFLPPISGMEDTLARLVFALKNCCVAILFCFVMGIEAVAHERLRSAAIDPLSGYETRRMQINLRYLQHTLEQLVVFVPGVLGLAIYCSDGRSMRAVAATTVVWIVARFAFWIGYHLGSQHRAAGAPAWRSACWYSSMCAQGSGLRSPALLVRSLCSFCSGAWKVFSCMRQSPFALESGRTLITTES